MNNEMIIVLRQRVLHIEEDTAGRTFSSRTQLGTRTPATKEPRSHLSVAGGRTLLHLTLLKDTAGAAGYKATILGLGQYADSLDDDTIDSIDQTNACADCAPCASSSCNHAFAEAITKEKESLAEVTC